jgi:copper oxidase (laccase) domain-containing protein
LDLWAANERALRESGVAQIEVAEMCTACRTDEFYSHRRERGRTGRFGVLISLGDTGAAR